MVILSYEVDRKPVSPWSDQIALCMGSPQDIFYQSSPCGQDEACRIINFVRLERKYHQLNKSCRRV